jgi:hypothetical protein
MENNIALQHGNSQNGKALYINPIRYYGIIVAKIREDYILIFLRHNFLYLFICHPITHTRIDLVKSTPLYLPTTRINVHQDTYS